MRLVGYGADGIRLASSTDDSPLRHRARECVPDEGYEHEAERNLLPLASEGKNACGPLSNLGSVHCDMQLDSL